MPLTVNPALPLPYDALQSAAARFADAEARMLHLHALVLSQGAAAGTAVEETQRLLAHACEQRDSALLEVRSMLLPRHVSTGTCRV